MGLSLPLFLFFHLFYIKQLTDKFLPMMGSELRISGVSQPNCATTIAQGWVRLGIIKSPFILSQFYWNNWKSGWVWCWRWNFWASFEIRTGKLVEISQCLVVFKLLLINSPSEKLTSKVPTFHSHSTIVKKDKITISFEFLSCKLAFHHGYEIKCLTFKSILSKESDKKADLSPL